MAAKTIEVCTPIPLSRVEGLLCCALEGGSNYWYMIEAMHKPREFTYRCDEKRIFAHLDYPLNVGGSLTIASLEEPERKRVKLNLPAIRRGLNLMAEKQPQHWGDFLAETEDASTGDVFLQLCLFGEVIYG